MIWPPIEIELQRGGRFVVFEYAISAVLVTFREVSDIHFIRAGESATARGLRYTLLSLLLGWWGFPWGPIYTIGALQTNGNGGKDVTAQVAPALLGNRGLPPPDPAAPADSQPPADHVQLWRGAILATIAHAIAVAPGGRFAHELAWDGINYSRQDSQGTRGTITFAPYAVFGAVRDDRSERAPWRRTTPYSYQDVLAGCPADLLALAERETFRYLLDEHNGAIGPVITAAFWGRSGALASTDPWPVFLAHGGSLLAREFMAPAVARLAWQEYYGWGAAEAELLETLFIRRMTAPLPVFLTPAEWTLITRNGVEGLAETRALLEVVGFALP